MIHAGQVPGFWRPYRVRSPCL